MSEKNMQRRSFFNRLVGAAAVTAVAVEAKPLVVSNHRVAKPSPDPKATVGVRVYSGYGCAFCDSAMMSFQNLTMRCTNPECPNYDKAVRLPVINAEIVSSDTEEVIRHALIILGVLGPGEVVCADDFKVCSEVVARIVREMNVEQRSWGRYDARDIRPYELAQALQPYYHGLANRTP
jgi:hypothetical protein